MYPTRIHPSKQGLILCVTHNLCGQIAPKIDMYPFYKQVLILRLAHHLCGPKPVIWVVVVGLDPRALLPTLHLLAPLTLPSPPLPGLTYHWINNQISSRNMHSHHLQCSRLDFWTNIFLALAGSKSKFLLLKISIFTTETSFHQLICGNMAWMKF